jgi:hypothetical protein
MHFHIKACLETFADPVSQTPPVIGGCFKKSRVGGDIPPKLLAEDDLIE